MEPHPQDSSSSTPSPTDTRRAQPSQAESQHSNDTVRRRGDASYGSIQPATPASGSQYLADPYERSGSRASGQTARSPLIGPERGRQRPKKPAMLRRTSSKAPHKGEIFSAEDDPEELQNDVVGSRPTYATAAAFNSDSPRQPSSIRRRSAAAPPLSRVQSSRSDGPEDDRIEEQSEDDDPMTASQQRLGDSIEEQQAGDAETGEDEDEDGDISDAESFTLKDRQQAINETHPFGIRIWKPALYKKDRSVQKTAEGDIHSSPGGHVSQWLLFFNLIWTLAFGWWMSLFAAFGALACFLTAAAPSGREYGRVLWGLAKYLFYPFGKYVRLRTDEAYLHEDEGEGRSISEYEQWQSGDLEYGRLFFGPDRSRSIIGRSRRSIDSEPSETESLLGRSYRSDNLDAEAPRSKRRLFGRGQWNIGRVIFFVVFYGLLTPSLFIASAICWFLVFWIPMGKVTLLLFDHLRRHPLALSFESDISLARDGEGAHSAILVCTYRATGWKYWKYTIDGTNIFLINLMAVVMFVIFDWLVLDGYLHIESFMTSPGFLFMAGLLSIIPLAYFIGQAVASISAQSSMGVGATVNAFFGTVVEVFLYCVALRQGKGQLVEGSIIGSIFAGVLFMPGLSMCFGAIKRKTQRFNSRSAGITSTMLLFAVIAAFGPTLFYQIYGTHELRCGSCTDYIDPPTGSDERDCRRCYYSQVPALDDRFYNEAVRPFCYIAAVLLFSSYMIGLMFTLRTHAAIIWNVDSDEKKHEESNQPSQPIHNHMSHSSDARLAALAAEAASTDIRDTNLFKRIYAQTSKQVGLPEPESPHHSRRPSGQTSMQANGSPSTPHMVPPKGNESGSDSVRSRIRIPGFADADNAVVRGVAELAATAAAIAARDARLPRRNTATQGGSVVKKPSQAADVGLLHDVVTEAGHGGHDAPNWSRTKSSVILLGATFLYAIIAELLVDTVDVVLDNYPIDPKFLGITLFALVPNTTEFLNAISFAINGNVALSMEIGSAYALQVCLLQIPALVLFSAVFPITPTLEDPDPAHWTFSLLFPQWDLVTVILCVFLLSYMMNEGKSNYFKGSILVLAYFVVITGFYFSSFTDGSMDLGMSRFDTLDASGQYTSYKTIGRGTGGRAYQA